MSRLYLMIVLVAAMVGAVFVFMQGGGAREDNRREPLIINGKGVPDGKYEFMVALLDKRQPGNAFQKQFCAGTLIDEDSVLTAAHCFFDAQGNQDPASLRDLKVTVGRTALNSNQGEVRSITQGFIHSGYKPKSRSFDYDAVVLQLGKPVSSVKPIKLSNQNNLEQPGLQLRIAGWGSLTARPGCGPDNADPVFPTRLQEARVPIVSDSEADQLYRTICQFSGLRNIYTPSLMVAAGGGPQDTCQADSGGPLFAKPSFSKTYTQVGITSSGPGCGPGIYPTAYTEVNANSIASFIDRAAQ